MTNLKIRNILISDIELFLIKGALKKKMRPVSYSVHGGFLCAGTYCTSL